jgi:hypothetical protein
MYPPGYYIIAGAGDEALQQVSQLEGNTARAINWHSRPVSNSKNLGILS